MKIKLVASLILALALLAPASPVYAIPVLPHAFYGDVEINGASAPDGSSVSATVSNGTIVAVQNPVTTVGGSYGVDSPKLLVQGDNLSGAITFYVNGHQATPSQAVTFEVGGGPTPVDLSVTIAAPPSAPLPTIETTLFGIEGSFRISSTGEILETIEATSEDGMLTITIIEGTIALLDGEPLETLTSAVDPSPLCPPPEDAHIIGLTYAFEPDGATFAPPITFTWSYDPDALPVGVAEKDLIIAYCDKEAGEWVELPCVVDTENNIITASVAHFTTFAIIAVPVELPPVVPVPAAFSVSYLSVSQLEVEPGETVTITVLVANTGGESGSYTVVLNIDGVKEAEETVTIVAGESQDVSFSVTREEAASYTVTVDGLSGSFTVVPVVVPPEPAAFSVSSISVLPAEVEPGEIITVSIVVANTGGESGSYTVVLKIDGVKEAEETVTVAAGSSQTVTFSVTKEEAGSYTVAVDGLSGSFTVAALAKPPGINWAMIGGIIGGVIVVGLLIFFVLRRREY